MTTAADGTKIDGIVVVGVTTPHRLFKIISVGSYVTYNTFVQFVS